MDKKIGKCPLCQSAINFKDGFAVCEKADYKSKLDSYFELWKQYKTAMIRPTAEIDELLNRIQDVQNVQTVLAQQLLNDLININEIYPF